MATAAVAPSRAPIDWAALVSQIQTGDESGMERLYALFNRGVRFYLCSRLGPQELEDRVHDTFLIVVSAIQRGTIQEPERLTGFIRTIVKRQVAHYIDELVKTRGAHADEQTGHLVADTRDDPEKEAMIRETAALMQQALASLSARDREILTRFYLKDQTNETIMAEMRLTETQVRLIKSRAKEKFGAAGKRLLAGFGYVTLRRKTAA